MEKQKNNSQEKKDYIFQRNLIHSKANLESKKVFLFSPAIALMEGFVPCCDVYELNLQGMLTI